MLISDKFYVTNIHEYLALGDDPEAGEHMIASEKSVAVVLLHNHPSTQTFSLQDIQFFVQHPIYAKAFELFRECVGRIDRKSSSVEMYMASLEFLAKCSETGLYYR